MSRIPPDENVRVTVGEGASGAMMTTLFGVMAHRPAIMQHAQQLLEATMREGTVDTALKELLAVRVSQVNDCFY
jgi:alkylhydroperoxidase family enzyme